MTNEPDLTLSAQKMEEELRLLLDPPVPVYWQAYTTSTNEDAKRAAQEGAPSPSVYGAEEQSAGRGRLQRTWESGAGLAVEMSFLFRPQMDPSLLAGFNFAAALGICAGLKQCFRLPARIKWPNDVVVHGAKICGILSESSSIRARTAFVVTGTGINVNQTQFPEPLEKTATSVALLVGKTVSRAKVAAACIEQVIAYARRFEEAGFSGIMEEYRAVSSVLDHRIRVLTAQGQEEGTCIGFEDTGAILVRIGDSVRSFNANDVSIRGT